MEVNDQLLQQLVSELKDLKKTLQTRDEQPYIDMKGAAKFLMISMSKMQKLSADRVFPAFKPNNGKIYFKRDDLVNYLESSRIKSKYELMKEPIGSIH